MRVTRSRTLRAVHRTHVDGVWVATVPRALLDAAVTTGRERLRVWLVDGRQRTVAVPGRVLHPDRTIRGVPVGIEVDGYGSHNSRHAVDLDRRRHHAYAPVGWLLFRIGWDRLANDPDGFVRELHETVGRVSA